MQLCERVCETCGVLSAKAHNYKQYRAEALRLCHKYITSKCILYGWLDVVCLFSYFGTTWHLIWASGLRKPQKMCINAKLRVGQLGFTTISVCARLLCLVDSTTHNVKNTLTKSVLLSLACSKACFPLDWNLNRMLSLIILKESSLTWYVIKVKPGQKLSRLFHLEFAPAEC